MTCARCLFVCLVVFVTGQQIVSAQTPLGSEFTYQGYLEESGAPATGAHGFDFQLYDEELGGNQIGPTINVVTVVVAGNFNAELDFGADSLNGDERWLEIVVNGTTLSPRQPITATPYSVQTRGIFVSDDKSFVGVGRNTSVSNSEYFGVHAAAPNGTYGGMYMSTDGESAWPFYGYAAGGTTDAWHYYDGATGDWKLNNGGTRMTIGNDGYAAIGSALVAEADGSVELGSSTLSIANDGFVGVGRDTRITASEAFGVYTNNTGFGGMYMETAATGSPFYGYSAGGGVDAFHYFDGTTGKWHLNNGGQSRVTVADDGFVGIGCSEPPLLLGARLCVQQTNGWPGVVVSSTDPADWVGYGYFAGDNQNNFDCATIMVPGTGNWTVWNGGPMLNVGFGFGVGIGVEDPIYMFQVGGEGTAGKPGGGSWSNSSDRRLKKNIADLDGSLKKLMSLRGVTFEYIDPDSINELDGQRIGMIAQEVEQVFPDWVEERADGYKAVTFRGFEALTVEALRELRAEKDSEIQSLENDNRELRVENAELGRRLETLEATVHLLLNQTQDER